MTNSGLSPHALLVVDNSLLAMLCDYFCERNSASLSGKSLVRRMQKWITDQLDTLRRFTPDGCMHCTDLVASEFKPIGGRLGLAKGVDPSMCRALRQHVHGLLSLVTVPEGYAVVLRNLPQAPRRLVGPDGLSAEDFSLALLALDLTKIGSPVYVLTNDQDLLTFISWMRSKRTVRDRWKGALLIQGLLSLSYLELLHRECSIETEDMKDLIMFALIEHYERDDLVATLKGRSITQQLVQINGNLITSVARKQAGVST